MSIHTRRLLAGACAAFVASGASAHGSERELCSDGTHTVQATYNLYRASECLHYTDDLEKRRRLYVVKQWAAAELVGELADKPQGAELAKIIIEAPGELSRMFLLNPNPLTNKDEMYKARGCDELPRCVVSRKLAPKDRM